MLMNLSKGLMSKGLMLTQQLLIGYFLPKLSK
jgi:hypothetical protein